MALDTTLGLQAQPNILRCCGYDGPKFVPDPLEILFFGNGGFGAHALDCSGTDVDISFDFNNWWSGNSSIAQVTYKNAYGASPGFADGFASGEVEEGNASYCTLVQEQLDVPITVQKPDHLLVESDTQKALSCSGNPEQRKITYEIVDANNQQVVALPAIREQFQNLSTDSCGGSISTTQTCTTVNGAFTDTLTAGCVLSGHSTPCGFTADQQQWQWCDPNGTTPTLGIPGALTVDNNLVSVGGNITGFTPGYSPPK